MTIVGDFIARLFGPDPMHHQVRAIDREIARHKADIRQSTQVLESGSRVMKNMTGVMRMMAEAGREDNQ
ncbi:hypothetical protein DEM27_10290 [Metarhizobium album]|uniref:Uncharacterized protein n=1 Tax=Metarhizobium album TaxID=2182425 RepID=A0A2U2DTV8_9HYPH|nr:hypothetical protein [Rhizobium album]PWE56743.1 hypothetical protein DEM27_10290 [Rhizobium album]